MPPLSLSVLQVVGSHALMKAAYDRQLKDLQKEVDTLSKERMALLQVRRQQGKRVCSNAGGK